MSSHLAARPELLAPAGDWDCIRAAVENGADAVYFGLDCGFNARARAANFSPGDLPEIMGLLHRRGVRGYVTLNTLAFPSELAGLETVIRQVAEAGVDAVLVQDLGVVRLIRAICPDLAIHASTQMTLTSAECIQAAEELGVERVVLARELSVREIRRIHEQTRVELEAFVHGALCVAYSGQCLTSESLGGRSANRGQCAQACRLPYELVCDGRDVDLGDVKYLLSPQDLAAFELLPQLMDAGVHGLKIEGRLKTAEYVANVTRHYRQAVETAIEGRAVRLSDQDVRELELSFSRGFSPGWLGGCDHKMLVPGLSSAKRGVLLGEVQSVRGQQIVVQLASPVAPGDGVVFEGDRSAGREQGGRVYHVTRNGQPLQQPATSGRVELAFERTAIDVGRLWVGQQVWKTDDPQLTQRIRKTFCGPDPHRRVPLDLHVKAAVGQPLRIQGRASSGAVCQVESDGPLEAARKHPLTEDLLRQQLGRLGGSAYELRNLDVLMDGNPMVPLSVLGKVRHAMVSQLDASVAMPPQRRISQQSVLADMRSALQTATTLSPDTERNVSLETDAGTSIAGVGSPSPPQLRVLCRTLDQLRTLVQIGVSSVMVDFQDIRQYREAVAVARRHNVEIYLATPRIQKPDEMGIFHVMRRHQADGILVRNLAGLQFFHRKEVPIVADYSLNTANELTALYLREQGARRVTASYDLNREQLLDLVSAVPASWLEVVIHQHMPMFHMEHCVFCAVLSPGTNKTNCGRPCDVHEVRLRDRIGMEHPLKADVGCRNTLYNAVPQSAAEAVPELRARGVCHYRLELLDDPPESLEQLVQLYHDLLAGRTRGNEVWQRLKASNRVGVTRGTLEERRNPLAIL